MFWASILISQGGDQDEASGVSWVRIVHFLPVLPVAQRYKHPPHRLPAQMSHRCHRWSRDVSVCPGDKLGRAEDSLKWEMEKRTKAAPSANTSAEGLSARISHPLRSCPRPSARHGHGATASGLSGLPSTAAAVCKTEKTSGRGYSSGALGAAPRAPLIPGAQHPRAAPAASGAHGLCLPPARLGTVTQQLGNACLLLGVKQPGRKQNNQFARVSLRSSRLEALGYGLPSLGGIGKGRSIRVILVLKNHNCAAG